MRPNWTALITMGLTVLVGLTCLVLALTVGKDNQTAAAFLYSTAGAALGSFLKQPQKTGGKRDTEAGCALPSRLTLLLLSALAAFFVLALSMRAHAAGWETVSPGVYKSGSWVAHPNFTVSAGQVNLKEALDNGLFTGGAIERVALMGGYGLTYHGDKLTLGAGIYAGTGISAKTPNAPQVNFLFTFWDALAGGFGGQRVTFPSGKVAYQVLFTVGLNYAAGGTVSKVAPWFDKLLNACVTGAACAL